MDHFVHYNYHHVEATYTCGLYGMFQDSQGDKYQELTSVCGWNKSWVPEVSFRQSHCQLIIMVTL